MIYSKDKSFKYVILEYTLTLIINSIVLILASKIFKGFYIQSFGYAIITSLVISLLSSTVKPFLKLIFLPVTVITTGIFYPFINVIILKLASLIMGDTFVVEGWILPFFIALFISFTTLILDKLITKNVIGE
ncbi:MAG: phage holin family protein [Tenericutes bacterium]|nr:phage holin family protein [Mycoplasmatota bacterium]